MKLTKLFFIIAMAYVLLMAHVNAIPVEEEEEEGDFFEEKEVPLASDSVSTSTTDIPSSQSEEPSSLEGLGRFLLAKNKTKNVKCNKNPKICLAKGSPGPYCCKKKCVDMRTDRLNCGGCGKKCRYNQTCCKGKCVNLATNKNHCGSCNNRCGSGDFCTYGLCNYAS